MFVHYLNSQQQSILISLAKNIISADSILSEKEKLMLDILKSQANSDISEVEVEIFQLPSIFVTKREKYSLLLELLGIAHADQEYQLEEQSLIKLYAECLNVSDNELNVLEKWVEKQLALSIEIESLLGE